MDAINARTGKMIVGTFERLTGRCPVNFDGRMDSNGRPVWDHVDGTEIFWDGARTQTTEDGQAVFLDENGHEVPHGNIELITAYANSAGTTHCAPCADRKPLHERGNHALGASAAKGRKCAECGGDAGAVIPEPTEPAGPAPQA